jgi:ABC-2 type transport system ATP-binding protein
LIHQPQLLILDEPASGLDPEARITLAHLFRTLQAQGITLIVSSHILAELEDYCTAMLVLRDGSIMTHHETMVSTVPQIRIKIGFLESAISLQPLLANNPGISDIKINNLEADFTLNGGDKEQSLLLKFLIDQGIALHSFSPQQTRLQDVYMSLSQQKDPV